MQEQQSSPSASDQTESGAEQSTHFGFRQVERSKKASLVAGVFDSVAAKYDMMNDLMAAESKKNLKKPNAKPRWSAAIDDAVFKTD